MIPIKIMSLLLLVLSTASAECPAGYEVVGLTCIHRSEGGYLTHTDAATYCHQMFGRLPVLSDCVSFTDVATYIDDGGSSDAINGYWLGATNLTTNGVWQWSDGVALQMGAPYWAAVSGIHVINTNQITKHDQA
ncbi:perlucin-like protein [Hyalella azteca]|uniref:Perlucin-like protein n=1 Tax=Hyalella azteca TaxID=294128 RepID=A0A8B7NXS0_HYAAZ|nr:perlucin-like protein [Hyalella azteca]